MPCNIEKCKSKCCKETGMVYENNPQILAWIKARGIKIVQKNDAHVLVSVPHICKELNVHTNKCKIYGKRPIICNRYPQTLSKLSESGLDMDRILPNKCTMKWNEELGIYE